MLEEQRAHLEEAERKRWEIFRAMTPEQKLRIAGQMRIDARLLKAIGLRMRHPEWSEEQVQEEVKRIFLHART